MRWFFFVAGDNMSHKKRVSCYADTDNACMFQAQVENIQVATTTPLNPTNVSLNNHKLS